MKHKLKNQIAFLLAFVIAVSVGLTDVNAGIKWKWANENQRVMTYYVEYETENEKWNYKNYYMLATKIYTDKNEPVVRYRYPITPKTPEDFANANLDKTNYIAYKIDDGHPDPYSVDRVSVLPYVRIFAYTYWTWNSKFPVEQKYIDALLASGKDYIFDNDFSPLLGTESTNNGFSYVIGRELDELLDFVMQDRQVNILLSELTVNKDGSVVFDKSTEMITGLTYWSGYKEPRGYFRHPAKAVWYQVEGYTKNREKIILSGGLEVDYKIVEDIYKYYKEQAAVEFLYYKTFRYDGKEMKLRVIPEGGKFRSFPWKKIDLYIRTVDIEKLVDFVYGDGYSAKTGLTLHGGPYSSLRSYEKGRYITEIRMSRLLGFEIDKNNPDIVNLFLYSGK